MVTYRPMDCLPKINPDIFISEDSIPKKPFPLKLIITTDSIVLLITSNREKWVIWIWRVQTPSPRCQQQDKRVYKYFLLYKYRISGEISLKVFKYNCLRMECLQELQNTPESVQVFFGKYRRTSNYQKYDIKFLRFRIICH